VVAGREQMQGSVGSVIEWASIEGRVRVHGEAWHARSPHRLFAGQRVRVVDIDGLTVVVEPDEPVSNRPERSACTFR
jgi:membrane-bound serine protease (ClpP class)